MHYNAFQRSPTIRNALTTCPIAHQQFCLTFRNDFPPFFNALAMFPNILIPKAIPINYDLVIIININTYNRTLKIHRVLKRLQTNLPTLKQISCHAMLLFSAMINTENKVPTLDGFF